MSERTETEIKAMTKEQNYFAGYSDAKSDVLDKIRDEIEQIIREEIVVDSAGGEYERIVSTIDPDDVLEIIDKYKAESEE